MKPIYDLLTATITNHHLDVRTLLEWGASSLDFHDVCVWAARSARWYACQFRAGLARAKAAMFPPGPAADLPIVTVTVQGGLIEDMDATIPLHVVTLDWDVPDEDTGMKPTRSVWTLAGGLSGPKAATLRRLIAND